MAPTRKRSKKLKQNRKISLKGQGPVNQLSHVGVRFHKGYVYDDLKYTVLTCTQMSAADHELVEATLKTVTTGAEAMTLPSTPGWRTVQLDQLGRTYVVSYNGIETALFYKRQLTEVRLQPGDRFPEGVMQDPLDAWQRLDLLGPSAKRANLVLSTSMQRIEDENKLYIQRLGTLDDLNDSLVKEKNQLKEQISGLEIKLKIKEKRAKQRAARKEKLLKKKKRRQ